MKTTKTTTVCVLLAGLLLAGCEEKKPPLPLAPSASALTASAPPPGGAVVKLAFDPKSGGTIDMPAPKERIAARVEGASGKLELVPNDLTKTRGEVKLDLLTLSTSTFKDDRDKDQTAHARTWLEVADGNEGKLPDDVKERNRYAVFAIRSVENASATDLTKVVPTKDASGADIRRVTLTTKGELLVHGHKVDREAEVEVALAYPAGAPADKPTSATVTTRKPLRVILAEHDVKPRDAKGKLAKDFFHLLGTKVADTADVSLELLARAEP